MKTSGGLGGVRGGCGGVPERLEEATTIVVDVDREPAGFASLKDDSILDMLYVHPYHAGTGIGTALCDALETLAKGARAAAITSRLRRRRSSFFEARDYTATQRNSVERYGEWLATTTMKKTLNDEPAGRGEDSDDGEA